MWDVTVFAKNHDRPLAGEIAARFPGAVLTQPRVKALLSDEHFSVDGTLIQAWPRMKSFRRTAAPLERSLGTSLRYGLSWRGLAKRLKSPTSAITMTATISPTPRIAWTALTTGANNQLGSSEPICSVSPSTSRSAPWTPRRSQPVGNGLDQPHKLAPSTLELAALGLEFGRALAQLPVHLLMEARGKTSTWSARISQVLRASSTRGSVRSRRVPILFSQAWYLRAFGQARMSRRRRRTGRRRKPQKTLLVVTCLGRHCCQKWARSGSTALALRPGSAASLSGWACGNAL